MTRTMNNEDFKQWQYLSYSVVNQSFQWAYQRRDGRTGRLLSYDDLVSEGNMALVKAWRGYDESRGATFKTYAYQVIYNQISRYVDANITALTTRDWKRCSILGSEHTRYEIQQSLCSALKCRNFSELEDGQGRAGHDNDGRPESFAAGVVDKNENPAYDIDDKEWVNFCMGRLSRALSKREMKILMEWASGKSLNYIGKRRRFARQWARIVINGLLIKAASALYDQEEHDKDNNS